MVQNEAAVDQQGRTGAEIRLLHILVNTGNVWRGGTRGPSGVLRGRGRGRVKAPTLIIEPLLIVVAGGIITMYLVMFKILLVD